MYNKFSRWLDTALSGGMPNNVVALNFNIYENGTNNWTIELVGTDRFEKDDPDWACSEVTDFNTRTYTFAWRENTNWQKVLKKVCYLIKKYLKNGKFARLLKSRKAVGAGFVNGDLKIIYKQKEKKAVSRKTLLLIIYGIGLLLLTALYVYEVFVDGGSATESLPKFIIVFVSFGLAIAKTLSSTKRSLSSVENFYAKEIGTAFQNDKKSKKLLISALTDYNRNKNSSCLNKLNTLLSKIKTDQDKQVVYFFSALCYEEQRKINEAIEAYRLVLQLDPNNSTALSNVCRLFSKIGNYEMAIITAKKSIENDSNNHFAYNNLAHTYLRMFDTENAKAYALQALKINPGFRQAATLLAVVYTAENNFEKARKYTSIAVAAGEKEEDLKKTALIYKAQLQSKLDFKEKLSEWTRLTAIPAIRISLDGQEGKSIVGGQINEPLPLSDKGEEMRLLAAIFCSELPANNVFPKHGVLRFYITPDDYYGADIDEMESGLNKQKGFRVLFDENETKFVTSELDKKDENFPVFGSYKLSFSYYDEPMSFSDYRYTDTYNKHVGNGENIAIAEEDMEDFFQYICAENHKLGGYPYFTQEDPRDISEEYMKYDTLLLQLSSEYSRNEDKIMFGDAGVCNFFIPGDKLKNHDFSDILYTWDCS